MSLFWCGLKISLHSYFRICIFMNFLMMLHMYGFEKILCQNKLIFNSCSINLFKCPYIFMWPSFSRMTACYQNCGNSDCGVRKVTFLLLQHHTFSVHVSSICATLKMGFCEVGTSLASASYPAVSVHSGSRAGDSLSTCYPCVRAR